MKKVDYDSPPRRRRSRSRSQSRSPPARFHRLTGDDLVNKPIPIQRYASTKPEYIEPLLQYKAPTKVIEAEKDDKDLDARSRGTGFVAN